MRSFSRELDSERIRYRPRVLWLHSRVCATVVSHQILRFCLSRAPKRSHVTSPARFGATERRCGPRAESTRTRRSSSTNRALVRVRIQSVWAAPPEEVASCPKPTWRIGFALCRTGARRECAYDSRVAHVLSRLRRVSRGPKPCVSPPSARRSARPGQATVMRLATEITEPHPALLRPVEQPAPECDYSG